MLEMCTANTDRSAYDDASRVSLGPGKRRCCVLDALGRRLVETQKKLVLEQLRMSGSGL